MEKDHFFLTKMNKSEGETLWREIESSLRSFYHYEGDLHYFLEHRESARAGKSITFVVPVSTTRHSKNGYDPSFAFDSPEGVKMRDWLDKKDLLGSGKLILFTLKSYGRRPEAKTSFSEAWIGNCTKEEIGEAFTPLLGYFHYLYFPESHYFCFYDSDVSNQFEFIPV
jgi:hypothetical protein